MANKIKCDAEVGSNKRGWHSCNRKVVVASERAIKGKYAHTLYYCKRHEKRAHKAEGIVSVIRVTAVAA